MFVCGLYGDHRSICQIYSSAFLWDDVTTIVNVDKVS